MSAHLAKETSLLASSTCRESARFVPVIIGIFLRVTEKGCKIGKTCFFIHNKHENSQGKKQKGSTPDKAKSALIKHIRKLGCISRKTELSREPNGWIYGRETICLEEGL